MKFPIIPLLLASSLVSTAFAAERYKDKLFDQVKVTKDVVYASGVNMLNVEHELITTASMLFEEPLHMYVGEALEDTTSLYMDVYEPVGDIEENRAAVLIIHGGAFVAGAKDDKSMVIINYCEKLARMGYMVFSMEYRLGVSLTAATPYTIESDNFSRTVYRGIQDSRSAVRFIRSKAKDYRIDVDRLYIVGNSAGAILGLENIYMDKESEIPDVAYKDSDLPNLGKLDEYGVAGENSRANGVVALWGAVHDLSIIEDEKTPVFMVHGTADKTVPYKSGKPLQNLAGTFDLPDQSSIILDQLLKVNSPELYGSYLIDSVLTMKGIEHEFYSVDGAGHEVYDLDDQEGIIEKKTFDFLYRLAAGKGAPIHAIVFAKASGVKMGEGNRYFVVSGSMSADSRPYAVVDLKGRAILSGKATVGENVDLTMLERGVYLLKVKGEKPVRFGIYK